MHIFKRSNFLNSMLFYLSCFILNLKSTWNLERGFGQKSIFFRTAKFSNVTTSKSTKIPSSSSRAFIKNISQALDPFRQMQLKTY